MSTSSAPVAPPRRAQGAPYARSTNQQKPSAPRPEPRILFQNYFKSVGPRTYAAQVKEASNGNHFVVLTESKRDEKSDQPRMTRLFVFSEDFVEFFKLIKETAEFIKSHPVPEQIRRKRSEFWSKQNRPERQAEGR